MKLRISALGIGVLLFAAAGTFAEELFEDVHVLQRPKGIRGYRGAPGDFVQLKDGALLFSYMEGGAIMGMKSSDKGKTWGDRQDFPTASDTELMYSHSRYTRMLDGRIAALQWTQDVGAAKDFDLHFTISDKTGTEWSEPQPTGIMGQTSWVADLGQGLLIATYSLREREHPGVYVILSEDEGKTWDIENQINVWDAIGQEFLGVVHRPTYPASHDNIAFGKPNTARLPNGEIICSWWCTQACVTHARFARVAVV